MGIAQSEYAEKLLEDEVYNKEKEQTVKRDIPGEDKLKAENLKKSAVENLKKYLELAPDADDKEDAEELIKEYSQSEDKE